jgi:hypothetical protein
LRLNRPEEALEVLDQGIKNATLPSVQNMLLDATTARRAVARARAVELCAARQVGSEPCDE